MTDVDVWDALILTPERIVECWAAFDDWWAWNSPQPDTTFWREQAEMRDGWAQRVASATSGACEYAASLL